MGQLMYGVIAAHYPTAIRGSAIGFCLGIGRIGAILGPQIGALFATPRAGLLAFMIPSLVGAGLVLVLAASITMGPRVNLVQIHQDRTTTPVEPEPIDFGAGVDPATE